MRPLLLVTLAAATVAQTVTVDVTKAVRERYEAFPYPAVKEGTDEGDIPSEYHWLSPASSDRSVFSREFRLKM